MIQGVVVFVPGTYWATRSNRTVESELLWKYYGMPCDVYTLQVNSIKMCVSKHLHLCGQGVGMGHKPQVLGVTALVSVSSLL